MAMNPVLVSVPTVTTTETDRRHMAAALVLADRGLGRTWPNPSVGCVLVRHGRIVGRGVTAPGGRPHAETQALDQAGEAAQGATAYVTLEPCAHQGQTPPCCDALISAGVVRVVVALEDPDPRTSGSGIQGLRSAGIEVCVGILENEAREHQAGFLSRIIRGRALVTLKVAASLDGRTATHTGNSKWITGESARNAGHLLRAKHDAIMVGSGTALADNPSLTCRLPGLDKASPTRIVVDSGLRLSTNSKLVTSAREVPTWIFCGENCESSSRPILEKAGVTVFDVRRRPDGRLALEAILSQLGEQGVTRLLVEGGAAMATGLLREDLVDRVAWFSAPKMIGKDGLASIGELGIEHVGDARRWRVMTRQAWQDDSLVMLSAGQ